MIQVTFRVEGGPRGSVAELLQEQQAAGGLALKHGELVLAANPPLN